MQRSITTKDEDFLESSILALDKAQRATQRSIRGWYVSSVAQMQRSITTKDEDYNG